MPLSIDIFCRPGPQQQTCPSGTQRPPSLPSPSLTVVMGKTQLSMVRLSSPLLLRSGRTERIPTENCFFLSRYNPKHVFHRLLPPPENIGYNLRERTHNLTLSTDGNAVIKENFVYRKCYPETSINCVFKFYCYFVLIAVSYTHLTLPTKRIV